MSEKTKVVKTEKALFLSKAGLYDAGRFACDKINLLLQGKCNFLFFLLRFLDWTWSLPLPACLGSTSHDTVAWAQQIPSEKPNGHPPLPPRGRCQGSSKAGRGRASRSSARLVAATNGPHVLRPPPASPPPHPPHSPPSSQFPLPPLVLPRTHFPCHRTTASPRRRRRRRRPPWPPPRAAPASRPLPRSASSAPAPVPSRLSSVSLLLPPPPPPPPAVVRSSAAPPLVVAMPAAGPTPTRPLRSRSGVRRSWPRALRPASSPSKAPG
jgi:hypothetical protein